MIRYGTVLKAKDHHSIYQRGGDGIAFVTHNGEGTDFFTFMWVGGDPAAPAFSGDTGTIKHLDKWFEIIPQDKHAEYLPAGFVAPPNPVDDPEAAFRAMFNFDNDEDDES